MAHPHGVNKAFVSLKSTDQIPDQRIISGFEKLEISLITYTKVYRIFKVKDVPETYGWFKCLCSHHCIAKLTTKNVHNIYSSILKMQKGLFPQVVVNSHHTYKLHFKEDMLEVFLH